MPMNWRNGAPFCDSRGAAVSGPVTMPPVHKLGWPDRHCGQLPQKPDRQATTWSPVRTVVTSGPTASTMPAPSWPSTIGRSSGKRPIPSTTCRSLWQTPVATVRTSTSRPKGLSMSMASIVSGSSTLRKTAACMSMLPSIASRLGRRSQNCGLAGYGQDCRFDVVIDRDQGVDAGDCQNLLDVVGGRQQDKLPASQATRLGTHHDRANAHRG